jgi:hypothetical protein
MHRTFARLIRTRITHVLAAAALCAAPAGAQGIGLAVGTLIPQGDLSEGAKSGMAAIASLEFGARKLALRIEALWANSDLDGVIIESADGIPLPDDANASGDVKFVGGIASLVLHLNDGPLQFYGLGGIGYYNRSVAQDAEDAAGDLVHIDQDDSELGWNFGAGLKLRLGPVKLFSEVRYHVVDTDGGNTNFVPILIGIRL